MTIVWEPNPSPDPDALERAFAMIFAKRESRNKGSGYPQAPLTDSAEELQFPGKSTDH